MKSVLQAAWLMTVAFGNVLVIAVAESRIFSSRAAEFFAFAALMAADTALLAWMAHGYKYADFTGRRRGAGPGEEHRGAKVGDTKYWVLNK